MFVILTCCYTRARKFQKEKTWPFPLCFTSQCFLLHTPQGMHTWHLLSQDGLQRKTFLRSFEEFLQRPVTFKYVPHWPDVKV